jgi:serine/threonine protein kinase
MTFAAGTMLGRYELLESLDRGRLSEVYRARDASIGRLVAVKVLPASLAADAVWLRRFEQEARAAGQLDHPSILSIHDVGVHEGRPYLVSEWLEGETLRERLSVTKVPWRKAVGYAIQIAQGIAAAHERGIVHRDLKPENLFLTQDGRVKILDFGLARVVAPQVADNADAEAPTAATATEPGVILGTVGYMSPEQVRGQPADARSDIFGLGAILFELATGKRAFRADSAIETMIAILREEPPPFPPMGEPPAALERVIRRCLEKRREERFQSARDVAYALEDLLAGAPDAVLRKRPPVVTEPPAGRRSSSSGGQEGRRRRSGPAEDSGFWLIFQDREVQLRVGETVLGRGRDATIRLSEKSVSRHHARIVIRESEATLENLRSKNGTFLHSERIESPTRLADGDDIRLGSVSLSLSIRPSTASTETESSR